jgi:hypothetical protein
VSDAIEYQSILLASSHPALPPPLRPHSKEKKEEETWASPKSKQASKKRNQNPRQKAKGKQAGPSRRFLQSFVALLSIHPSMVGPRRHA